MPEDKPNNIESALDRAQRVREYVERLIAEVGEHPECELKREWRRDSVYHRAEFIKDFQSIANSAIPIDGEKYIVVGADESTRAIVGCSHADFDEAGIRQVLETYLDPVPRFEVLRLTSTTGVHYVVIRIPYQASRPFIVKASIRDNNRTYLDEGQIWAIIYLTHPLFYEILRSWKSKQPSPKHFLKQSNISLIKRLAQLSWRNSDGLTV